MKTSIERVALRDAFGKALVNIGAEDARLRVLDADVSGSTKTCMFNEKYPDRFYNVGVAEGNLADIAAGMATCGLRPVISAFSLFLSLKATDQIRNVICYNKLPVIIAGGYGGLSDSFDGASHQSLVDIAIMRALPEMIVLAPASACEIEPALREALKQDKPVFIRLGRNPVPDLPELGENFQIGKGKILCGGTDVTIVSCGLMSSIALEAVESLADRGVAAELLHFASIKPLDTTMLVSSAQKTGAVVAVEEHTVLGGLGGAVAEVLGCNCPVPLEMVGVQDCFTESGPYDVLLDKYGLSVDKIVDKVKAVIARKK